MTRPPDDAGPLEAHLSVEDLGVIAEGQAASPEAIDHLSRCRRCMAAYADAVRYRGAWLASPEDFRAQVSTKGSQTARAAIPRFPLEKGAWIGAAVLIVVGVSVAALQSRAPMRDHQRVPASIQALLEQESAVDLVFPGGEAGAAGQPPAYRADRPPTEEAATSLENVRRRIEAGDRSPDGLYALSAGLIATGRLDLASDYLDEARRRRPQDHRFVVLAAIVAARRNEIVEAEHLLLQARHLEPRDPTVALNLGVVVERTQGLTAARPYLLEVIERAPDSPLAPRARRMLDRPLTR